jgi:hypothetical protein
MHSKKYCVFVYIVFFLFTIGYAKKNKHRFSRAITLPHASGSLKSDDRLSILQARRDSVLDTNSRWDKLKKEINDKVASIIPLVQDIAISDYEINVIKNLPLGLINSLCLLACLNALSLLQDDTSNDFQILTKESNQILSKNNSKDFILNKAQLKKSFDNKIIHRVDDLSSVLVTIFEKLCVMVIDNKDRIVSNNKVAYMLKILSNTIASYNPVVKGYVDMLADGNAVDTNMSIASLVLAGMNHDKGFFKKSNLWNLNDTLHNVLYMLQFTQYVSLADLKTELSAFDKAFLLDSKSRTLKAGGTSWGTIVGAGIGLLVAISGSVLWQKGLQSAEQGASVSSNDRPQDKHDKKEVESILNKPEQGASVLSNDTAEESPDKKEVESILNKPEQGASVPSNDTAEEGRDKKEVESILNKPEPEASVPSNDKPQDKHDKKEVQSTLGETVASGIGLTTGAAMWVDAVQDEKKINKKMNILSKIFSDEGIKRLRGLLRLQRLGAAVLLFVSGGNLISNIVQ